MARSVELGGSETLLRGEELREGVNVVLRELLCERLHEWVLALAEPVVVQGLRDVVRVLPGQVRVLIYRACAALAVAGDAVRGLFGRLAYGLGARDLRGRGTEVSREVGAILVGQAGREAAHRRVPARARLVLRKRGDDIGLVLAAELRDRVLRVRVLGVLDAVAAEAAVGELRAARGVTVRLGGEGNHGKHGGDDAGFSEAVQRLRTPGKRPEC